MEITTRSLWTMIHGMGFGALYLMACSGALVELYRRYCSPHEACHRNRDERFLRALPDCDGRAGVAHRAHRRLHHLSLVSRGAAAGNHESRRSFRSACCLSSPATSGWHSIGMEWKEHVAWLVPISITMAAAVFARYGRNLKMQPELRSAVLGFVWISLLAAGIAGFFGAMLNKNAPVEGGATHPYCAGRTE